MERRKSGSNAILAALLQTTVVVACSLSFVVPSIADIYRWEDERGVIHFTDDLSGVPPEYRGKAREIQKTPPASGQPSVSTMGSPPSLPADKSVSPGSSNGEASGRMELPGESDAAAAEKLRAKIDAKERFLRTVDERQSLATNPYRNRLVSPEDLELYRKYKEELPGDREHLKSLEPGLVPVTEP